VTIKSDDEHAALRNEEASAALELRRVERSAQAQADALERRLAKLDDGQRRSVGDIEDEYRREHFGRSWTPWPPEKPGPPADAGSAHKDSG
jgi:hypothetical protein